MDWWVFCSLQTWCHFVHFSEKLCRRSPNRSTGNGFASRTASCAISNSEGWYFGAANLYLGAWKFVPHINPKVFFWTQPEQLYFVKETFTTFFCNVWWRWIHLDESFFNWVESTWRWWISIGGENGKQQLRWRTWLWLQPTFQVAHLEFRISHLPIFDGKVDKSHIPQSFKLRVNA